MYWVIIDDQIDIEAKRHATVAEAEASSVEVAATMLGKAPEQILAALASAPGHAAAEVIDGTAEISVTGVLLPAPKPLYTLLGVDYSDYETIGAQAKEADRDPNVRQIVLNVDSPGGRVDGLVELCRTLATLDTPMVARVHSMAASGGYIIASQADKIEAMQEMSRIGSMGVVTERYVSNYTVSITNTDSPNKRPDPKTEQGRSVIRGELDEVFDVVAGIVADGRGVSIGQVKSSFGSGGTMLPAAAKRLGMIDTIQGEQVRATISAMDIDSLRADHREVYNAVVSSAVASERGRVTRLLAAGKKHNAMGMAIKKIDDGAAADSEALFDFAIAGESLAAADERSKAAPLVGNLAPSTAIDDNAGPMAVMAAVLENAGIQ